MKRRTAIELRCALSGAILGWWLCNSAGCLADDEQELAPTQLALPTGLAVAPDASTLFITNGDWDYRYASSTLVALDLRQLADSLTRPGTQGSSQNEATPCRMGEGSEVLECDAAAFINGDHTVRMGRGAGNIAFDIPGDASGIVRLLVPTRIDPGVTWIDASVDDTGRLRLDCGQSSDRYCDETHRVANIDTQPAVLTVDRLGFRFAYLPHLLGGRLSLIGLDGEFGPELRDVADEFFDPDPIHDSELAGGFAVAERACDVGTGNAPAPTDDCQRPYLYASQRFWWGLRAFRVSPGRDRLSAGGVVRVQGTSVDQASPRPLMGDVAFADPEQGHRLLVVHTTPPALAQIDTSLDDNGDTINELITSVPVCPNPNMVEVYRPGDTPALAFVSCTSGAEVVAVDLASFTTIAHIDVGEGANEMAIDMHRRWLFVANTAEGTVSIVDLRPGSARYLRELAVLGRRS